MAYFFNARIRKNFQTGDKLFYPTTCNYQAWDVDAIAEEISEQCTLTRADIRAVVVELQEQIRTLMLAGYTVRMGNIGSFRVGIRGVQAATPEAVDPGWFIVRTLFTPSSWLRKRLRRERLNFVCKTPKA